MSGTDDGRCDLVGKDLSAFTVDEHLAGERQTVLPFVQAADAVGKAERQHGQDAVDQIHAGTAGIGFPVDDTERTDIMAHVSDIDTQEIIIPLFFRIDCVIQIF